MLTQEQVHLGKFLSTLAEELDISPTKQQEAVDRYTSVSDWLSKPGSPLRLHNPELYPQGSFMLGTVTRPLSDAEEFDIDLVCRLGFRPDEVSQTGLKRMVGDRFRNHDTYEDMLEEKDRCWRLDYANEFHMDILPAIPQEYKHDGSILIPDKKLDENDWHVSNPKDYGAWFRKRMEVVFRRRQAILAEAKAVHIEDVPEWQVRTPLQRAIQILKRHRDIMFEDDPDDKPISIIITTLAAHAYGNEEDIYEALQNIVIGMPAYIQLKEGVSWVPNPVNSEENFADKWEHESQRETKFKSWLDSVRSNLLNAVEARGLHVLAEQMRPHFGSDAVNRTMKSMGAAAYEERKAGNLHVDPKTGVLGSVGVQVKDHRFYGQ
tara:strand:+ start:1105 stop:2235 length:1131 start_codon:yes stop_codon:yes gene_type:complete